MRLWCSLILLILSGLCGRAAGIEAVASHAVFRADSGVSILHIYWEIAPASLHYKRDSTGRLATRIQTRLRVSSDTGVVYEDLYWLQTAPFDAERESARRIIELQKARVHPGRLRIDLLLTEERHPESRFVYSDTLTVSSGNRVGYSTLQLLDTFYRASATGIFEQRGAIHVPRALNFYDDGQRSVSAYVELYRTQMVDKSWFPIIQTMWLSSSRGGLAQDGQSVRDTIVEGAGVLPFRRRFSTATFPSGNYYLNVATRSAKGLNLATASTMIQTLNKRPDAAARDTAKAAEPMKMEGSFLDLSTTFVSKFDVPQMRAILKMILPSAPPAEESAIQAFFQNPDALYMRYFIYNYFAAINSDAPGDAWKAFSDNIRGINRRFNSGSTMGYETDRGLIMLRYGPPAEEVRVPAEAGAQPYEIWRYNAGGRLLAPSLFLFYSPGSMSSDYRLLHSNVPGERQRPDWRAALYSTGRSSGNLNSRAEEYFGTQR